MTNLYLDLVSYASQIYPREVALGIVLLCGWAYGVHAHRTGPALRLQWVLVGPGFSLAALWCVLTRQIPWPYLLRRFDLPVEYFSGRTFPVLHVLMVLFLAGLAWYCVRRALAERIPDSN